MLVAGKLDSVFSFQYSQLKYTFSDLSDIKVISGIYKCDTRRK